MDCPIDGTTLVMSSRDGVEIDYCPECRGVWLDRGELDKIIDRAARQMAPAPPPASRTDFHDDTRRGHDERDRYVDRRHDTTRGPYKKKKKRSFLEDLFEFD